MSPSFRDFLNFSRAKAPFRKALPPQSGVYPRPFSGPSPCQRRKSRAARLLCQTKGDCHWVQSHTSVSASGTIADPSGPSGRPVAGRLPTLAFLPGRSIHRAQASAAGLRLRPVRMLRRWKTQGRRFGVRPGLTQRADVGCRCRNLPLYGFDSAPSCLDARLRSTIDQSALNSKIA